MLLARPDTFEDAVLIAERADAAIMFARGNKQHFKTQRNNYHNNRGN